MGHDVAEGSEDELPDTAKKLAEEAKDLKALRTAVVEAAGVSGGLWFSYLFVLLYLLIAAITISAAFGTSSALAAQDCASLANLKVENSNLLSATEVPAAGDLPAYCRVLGYVRPAINFEVRLPAPGLEQQVLHGRVWRLLRHARHRPTGFHERRELWPAAQLRRGRHGLRPLGYKRSRWALGHEQSRGPDGLGPACRD